MRKLTRKASEHLTRLAAAREERDRKIAERRAESEALRKEAPAPKAAVGFKQEVRKTRAIKRQEDTEGEAKTKPQMMAGMDGNVHEITPSRSSTAEDAISEHYNASKYSPEERRMNEHLIDSVNRLAGDTKVHYVNDADMMKLSGGEPTRGFYDPDLDHIVINTDRLTHDTPLHEVFHAATTKALGKDPELRGLMGRLHQEMLDHVRSEYGSAFNVPAALKYALSDPEEFLTGMMTNPRVQALLKQVKISDDLARAIGIPKWRKATGWHGVLHIIQRALGLSPRDVSAIEGAMAISEKAMWADRRGAGLAMEAGARSLGLRFQKDYSEGKSPRSATKRRSSRPRLSTSPVLRTSIRTW